MQVVNGKENEVVGILRDFGLCGYEARMYFTLLTIGEAKVLDITRKASVPQSKAYEVLESLKDKGFVEMSEAERPKTYRARVLEEVTDNTIKARLKEIYQLEKHSKRLRKILQAVAPIHTKYREVRLFTPSYQRLKKMEVV